MMKLTKEQRAQRKMMLVDLEAQGGEVFGFEDTGLTVVVVPAVDESISRFARVAVAQCDFIDDTFKRKVGEFIALERLESGETFSVPFNDRDAEEIAEAVCELMAG